MKENGLCIDEVVKMFYPMAEADLMKFAYEADIIINRNKKA
jgi:hypothetical protein